MSDAQAFGIAGGCNAMVLVERDGHGEEVEI